MYLFHNPEAPSWCPAAYVRIKNQQHDLYCFAPHMMNIRKDGLHTLNTISSKSRTEITIAKSLRYGISYDMAEIEPYMKTKNILEIY